MYVEKARVPVYWASGSFFDFAGLPDDDQAFVPEDGSDDAVPFSSSYARLAALPPTL